MRQRKPHRQEASTQPFSLFPPAATRAEYLSLKAQLQSETFSAAAPGGPAQTWFDLPREERTRILKTRLKTYCQKVPLRRGAETAFWSLEPRSMATGFTLGGVPSTSTPLFRLSSSALARPRRTPQVYKRVLNKPTTELRKSGVCQRENSFYHDTVESFRCVHGVGVGVPRRWRVLEAARAPLPKKGGALTRGAGASVHPPASANPPLVPCPGIGGTSTRR